MMMIRSKYVKKHKTAGDPMTHDTTLCTKENVKYLGKTRAYLRFFVRSNLYFTHQYSYVNNISGWDVPSNSNYIV